GLYAGLPGEMKGYCAGCWPYTQTIPHRPGEIILILPIKHQQTKTTTHHKKNPIEVEHETQLLPLKVSLN
ncbi:hypothetical protein, partial [Enterobacter hormaechei]